MTTTTAASSVLDFISRLLLDGVGVRVEGERVRWGDGDAEREPAVAAAELDHALIAEVADRRRRGMRLPGRAGASRRCDRLRRLCRLGDDADVGLRLLPLSEELLGLVV